MKQTKCPEDHPRHDENQARLARIEGQVKGIRRMVDEGTYCIDIITQIQAVRSALQSVSRRILRKHLEHCVSDTIRSGNTPDADDKIAELLLVMKWMEK